MKLAKFGCYVTRYKDGHADDRNVWDEHLSFRADPALEGTAAVWAIAKMAAQKKWKQTARSGWTISELWMEAPRNW